MCAVFNSTGIEFHNVGTETAKLRGAMRTVSVVRILHGSC